MEARERAQAKAQAAALAAAEERRQLEEAQAARDEYNRRAEILRARANNPNDPFGTNEEDFEVAMPQNAAAFDAHDLDRNRVLNFKELKRWCVPLATHSIYLFYSQLSLPLHAPGPRARGGHLDGGGPRGALSNARPHILRLCDIKAYIIWSLKEALARAPPECFLMWDEDETKTSTGRDQLRNRLLRREIWRLTPSSRALMRKLKDGEQLLRRINLHPRDAEACRPPRSGNACLHASIGFKIEDQNASGFRPRRYRRSERVIDIFRIGMRTRVRLKARGRSRSSASSRRSQDKDGGGFIDGGTRCGDGRDIKSGNAFGLRGKEDGTCLRQTREDWAEPEHGRWVAEAIGCLRPAGICSTNGMRGARASML